MFETLFSKDPGLLIPLVMAVVGALVGIVAIIAHQWRCIRQAEVEGALKQDMLNRGMSADEIERVIRVSNQPVPDQNKAGHKKQERISDNEYYLVEKLVDEGKSAEEIERIIRAVKAGGRSALPETVDQSAI
jgi:hypothetical protein